MDVFIVRYDAGAVADLEGLTGRDERKAVFTAVDKLMMLGPKLVWPHAKLLKGEPGLYELRPRQGSSRVRAIYIRVGDEYVILAFAIKSDKADFPNAVANARERSKRYAGKR